jgi:hypothetical protein
MMDNGRVVSLATGGVQQRAVEPRFADEHIVCRSKVTVVQDE